VSQWPKSATLAFGVGASSMLLASIFAALAIAQEQPSYPTGTSSVGPLRRGANGEIELATPADLKRAVTCPAASRDASAPAANKLGALLPGHWMAIPNSHLMSVAYKGPLAELIRGAEGPAAVMNDWSGGTLDTQNDQLIVWGGGHGGYFGNEVYAFSLKTLVWSRLTDPSSTERWSQTVPFLPDGKPSAQQTYDALTFLPSGQMFVAGSAGATPNGNSYSQSWLFNPSSGAWRQAAPYDGIVGSIAEYDSATAKVYAINVANGLRSYDPATDVWAPAGRGRLADYHMTGALDGKSGRLVATGGGHLQSIDLKIGAVTTLSSTGDPVVQNGNAPGFVWHPSANLFVGWNGGSVVYTLDPKTWHWTAYNAAVDNTVVPTAANGNGTFGRFQYDPKSNVFIAVNDVNQDVYIYKPCF
jgi:hypothetical protein